jgi:asparagine synthase (glutamine-hydrolysing)
MPGSLLNRLDRASMAHSLEARVPFLSHQFVDWSLTMPLDMKVRGKVGKYVLRKAAEPWFPPGALKGRKLGLQLPFAEWFRGDFSDFARDAWRASGAHQSGYLEAREVDAIFNEHRAGQANHRAHSLRHHDVQLLVAGPQGSRSESGRSGDLTRTPTRHPC